MRLLLLRVDVVVVVAFVVLEAPRAGAGGAVGQMVARQGRANGFVHVANDAGGRADGVRVVLQILLRRAFDAFGGGGGTSRGGSDIILVVVGGDVIDIWIAVPVEIEIESIGKGRSCKCLSKRRPNLRFDGLLLRLVVHDWDAASSSSSSVVVVVIVDALSIDPNFVVDSAVDMVHDEIVVIVVVVLAIIIHAASIYKDSTAVHNDVLVPILCSSSSGMGNRVVISNRGPVGALHAIVVPGDGCIRSAYDVAVPRDGAVRSAYDVAVSRDGAIGTAHNDAVATNVEVGPEEGLVVGKGHHGCFAVLTFKRDRRCELFCFWFLFWLFLLWSYSVLQSASNAENRNVSGKCRNDICGRVQINKLALF